MSEDLTSTLGVGRRALLTLGTAVLVGGCAQGSQQAVTTPSGTTPSPTGSGTGPAPAPTATGTATRTVCPTAPDVIPKPGTLQYLPCNGKDVALTIDDGPHPTWTPQVLAVLAKLDIRATFCMIGENAARHPDLVRQVAAAGHQIADHTYTHPMNLATMTRAQVDDQIHRTAELLTRAGGGNAPALFRAPGGSWSATILASCADAGLRPLDWSVDTRDWSLPGVSRIVDVLLTRTNPGSIILDHDGGGNRQQTVTALSTALPQLIDRGYRFVLP
ncbi:MAG TPA: polysaccharide deacetylase family protein [Kineosporiaceae bacterium]|nr:polysaccharide deacetylase family protein [Kineosporiaceae bacterium]